MAPRDDPNLPIADRDNMTFRGTIVLYGRGRGVAVATGMQTELGRIAGMLEGVGNRRTPLQRRLTVFGRQIAIAALAICALIFVAGLLRGEPPMLMLLTALSLAVAAIPEALPAVVTVLLALGAARMAREHALIRRLPAVETSVPSRRYARTRPARSRATRCAPSRRSCRRAHCRRRARSSTWSRPDRFACAGALQRCCARLLTAGRLATQPRWHCGKPRRGWDRRGRSREGTHRVWELPFDSERKCMTTLHHDGRGSSRIPRVRPRSVLEALLRRWRPTRDGSRSIWHANDARSRRHGRTMAFESSPWPAGAGTALPAEREAEVVEQRSDAAGPRRVARSTARRSEGSGGDVPCGRDHAYHDHVGTIRRPHLPLLDNLGSCRTPDAF